MGRHFHETAGNPFEGTEQIWREHRGRNSDLKEHIDLLKLYKKIFDILPTGNIQKLMDICYEVLGVPILTADIMYNLYGIAPKKKYGDYYWDYLLEHRCYTDEMIVQLYQEGIMQTADLNDTPYIIDFGEAGEGHPKLLGLIKVNHVTEGYVVMQCRKEEITPELEEAMKITANACGLLLKDMVKNHGYEETHKKIFTDALFNHRIRSQQQMELWFKKTGICLNAVFCILAIRMVHTHEKNILAFLRKSVQQFYVRQLSVIQNDTLYILLYGIPRKTDKLPDDRQLQAILSKFNACCGVSNMFDNLLEINNYQTQAHDALILGKSADPENRIHLYKNYYLPAIFSLHVSQMPVCNYVSPVITQIQQYDRAYSTDFSDTLKEYINNLCNATAAADALHIHRNSLMYRINKIEEITNVSLKDYKTFLHLIVSFYILGTEKK